MEFLLDAVHGDAKESTGALMCRCASDGGEVHFQMLQGKARLQAVFHQRSVSAGLEDRTRALVSPRQLPAGRLSPGAALDGK